jgi:PcfJ-like protein
MSWRDGEMDVKPKSNKLRRLEAKEKLARRAERQARENAKAAAANRMRLAEQALRESGMLHRGAKRVLRMIVEGQDVGVPPASDLAVIARLFANLERFKAHQADPPRPDVAALRRLALSCFGRTDFFHGREADQFAGALLALSAHTGHWIREPEDWTPRSHNTYRQFHALVRHLVARYDVPTFMNTAWLEGLTPQGVLHQRWFIHVAQGQNIRTAAGLPIPLTRKQAHHYLQAPDDFDVLRAFRWAQVIDLGGSERLVRSLLPTRIATEFAHDEFWVAVLRWLVAQPMLDPVHHGPIIDYLHHHRFVASVPNPNAHLPGEPRLVPAQPNLNMKGRTAETLLRSVTAWHRGLGRERAGNETCWPPSGIVPFRLEEGQDENRRVFTIAELLSSRELIEEGRAMGHCVGTYARSCAAGHVSIWSLKVTEVWGQETRLLTLEVWNQNRQIAQARGKFNKTARRRELAILGRWSDAGGPALSKWLAR